MSLSRQRVFVGLSLGVAALAFWGGLICRRARFSMAATMLERGLGSNRAAAAETHPHTSAQPNHPGLRAEGRSATVAGLVQVPADQPTMRTVIGSRDAGIPELCVIADQATLHLRFLGFYRQLNLPPDQIAQLESALLDGMPNLDLLDAHANSDEPSPELPAMEEKFAHKAAAIIGEAGAERLLSYMRSAYAREIVSNVGVDAFYQNSPLSAAEGDRLAMAITQASDMGGGRGVLLRRLRPEDIDFPKIKSQLGPNVSPEIILVLEAAQAKAKFDQHYVSVSGATPYKKIPGL